MARDQHAAAKSIERLSVGGRHCASSLEESQQRVEEREQALDQLRLREAASREEVIALKMTCQQLRLFFFFGGGIHWGLRFCFFFGGMGWGLEDSGLLGVGTNTL